MREEGAAVLQMDLGNSRLKWRLVSGDRVLARGAQALEPGVACDLPMTGATPEAVLVASVAAGEREQELAARIRDAWSLSPWFARSAGEMLGLRNSYAQPERLGVDRWLAMLAAWHPLRERVCVVDAGSALTIDLVAADGQHEGGYIVPGAALMEQSLLRGTQRVRFDETVSATLDPGTSTAAAVAHGALLAQCGAVRLALERAARSPMAPPRVVVTGGAGEALVGQLDAAVDLRRDLVFDGLALAAESR